MVVASKWYQSSRPPLYSGAPSAAATPSRGAVSSAAYSRWRGRHAADGCTKRRRARTAIVFSRGAVFASPYSTASAATQISSSSEELAAGAQEQSAQAQEVAAAVEQMVSTVVENARTATEAAKAVARSQQAAGEGGAVVGRTTEKVQEIGRQTADVETAVGEDGGPFTYIPRTHPFGRHASMFQTRKRLSDERVTQACAPESWRVCQGRNQLEPYRQLLTLMRERRAVAALVDARPHGQGAAIGHHAAEMQILVLGGGLALSLLVVAYLTWAAPEVLVYVPAAVASGGRTVTAQRVR